MPFVHRRLLALVVLTAARRRPWQRLSLLVSRKTQNQAPDAPPARSDATWFAVAGPGLEGAVESELRERMPALRLRPTKGGVEFDTTLGVARALLPELRIATRLWLRLANTRARAFGELERKWSGLPWKDFIGDGKALRIEVAVHRCRLYHSAALRERLHQAIVAAVGHPVPLVSAPKDTDDEEVYIDEAAEILPLRLLIRGEQDHFEVSVDAAGDRLHRRGYRLEIGKAPLRETLAAALLKLCQWRPDEALLDPMCGSGTIPIEAALMAAGTPLPAARAFAMDAWPIMRTVTPVTQGLTPPQRARPALICGFDRDPLVVARAQRNAERAGVAACMSLASQAFETLEPPVEKGLLLFNPPYGHRLATSRQWDSLARLIAVRWHGWRFGILLPRGVRLGRLEVQGSWQGKNGGLPVELVWGSVQ